MEREELEMALENYRYGVQKVIPAYLTGKMTDDEAFVDELALVLSSRDEVERLVITTLRLWRDYGQQIDEIDRLFLMLKDAMMQYAPRYRAFREQTPRPRSHWWYFLDEIMAPQEISIAKQAPPRRGYWMTVVAAREGVTA